MRLNIDDLDLAIIAQFWKLKSKEETTPWHIAKSIHPKIFSDFNLRYEQQKKEINVRNRLKRLRNYGLIEIEFFNKKTYYKLLVPIVHVSNKQKTSITTQGYKITFQKT